MRATLAMILAAACAPMPALASCAGELILSCPIGKKQLELCLTQDRLTYSFGPYGKPELVLTDAIRNVSYTPWSGVGRSMWDAVTFVNKGTTYEVWTSFDRLDPNAVQEGGVVVSKGGERLASLTCARGTVSTDLYPVYLAKTGAGQCWNYETHRWQDGGCP